MRKIIVTSAEKFNDIDSLACGVAYRDLLVLRGFESDVVFTGPLNESVCNFVKGLGFSYKTKLDGAAVAYDYVLVDNSDHTNISKFVPLNNIIEVFDHRWGFEEYWKSRSDVKAVIEPVGSCATLIWEQFKEYNFAEEIDAISASLLYIAIISNTLNLKAQITSPRDLVAVRELRDIVNLPENWKEIYFSEVSQSFLEDPIESIKHDTKKGPINGVDYYIMQVELWNSLEFIQKHGEMLRDLISTSGCSNTFLTSPSISEGFNYILAVNDEVKTLLSARIGAVFDGDLAKTSKLWLRKEIIRELSK